MSRLDELRIKEWLKEKRHKRGYYGDKLDRNGYAGSLFKGNRDGICFLCGLETDTARHEIYDASNRETSKAIGMWVCLCPGCHEKVHRNIEGRMDELHEAGQRLFEHYHSHEDFINLFGRNYL